MAAAAAEGLPFTDDLLADILIRLPTLADLGRACAVCPTFRRVITDHSFLRRLRTLHPQLLLGIVGDVYISGAFISDAFIPAEPPHPSAAAARTFSRADAIDFSCSFLPSPDCWRIRDLRDGRLLLSASSGVFVRDLAVCDPIHRRYILLPAIPDDLAALVHQQEIEEFMPFLASADDEDEGTNSFMVICLVRCKTGVLIFHISWDNGSWHASQFYGWGALAMELGNSDVFVRYYAHRFFCWVPYRKDKLLLLDTRTMEFSSVNLPPSQGLCQRAIVEAGEGMLGIFTLSEASVFTYQLMYTVPQNGQSANQQQPCVAIPLPLNYGYLGYLIIGVAAGYLLIQGIPKCFPSSERPDFDYFSLNLNTFKLERFCGTKHHAFFVKLYAGFPLSLSPPTI